MAVKYKVTGVTKRTILKPDGTFTNAYEVAFETQSGVKDTIDVPVELFTKEHVKAELDKAVANIEAIISLQG
jgi:hypothetical protein